MRVCRTAADSPSQNIKQDIEGRPVGWYKEVFDLVFPNMDRARANAVWKDQLEQTSGKDEESGKD